MADFLVLVVIYVVAFTATSYVFLVGATDYHRHGIIGKIRSVLIQMGLWIFDHMIPRIVQNSFINAVEHFLYTKNCYLQVLYCLLLSAITYTFHSSINPTIREALQPPAYDPTMVEVYLPFVYIFGTYMALSINLILFVACCYSDPGEITRENHGRFSDVYEFDGIMYVKENNCRTCDFEKPARSKHCAFCNRCVHRFDHHCSWVNNCIGGKNVHLFIALLVSITLGSVYGAFVIATVFVAMVRSKGILFASYVGADGNVYPVTRLIVFQHMFMKHPVLVLLMTCLCLLSILVGVFAAYHLYLAVTNQTTNERYKRDSLRMPTSVSRHSQSTITHSDRTKTGYKEKQLLQRNRTVRGDAVKPSTQTNFYNRGIHGNLREVFFPSHVSKLN